jgi:hypothetical protein
LSGACIIINLNIVSVRGGRLLDLYLPVLATPG